MRRLAWLFLLVTLTAFASAALAAQPPYDPRPLMEAADPHESGPFTFAVFGDSYANRPLERLLKMVSSQQPTFAITGGDMVRTGGDPRSWHTLSARAGWFLSSVPTWPVVGNHELSGSREAARAQFQRFYNLSPDSYAFTFRGCKFIVLAAEADARTQVAFLRSELDDRGFFAHVFVFRHVPFYTVGSKGRGEVPNRPDELTALFEEHRVTAVFTGHDHIYYRTRRGGVSYITAGVAGAGIYHLARVKEAQPGDAYMGLAGDYYLLHVPGREDRSAPRTRSPSGDWLFAVFVGVDGERVTAQTVSALGEVWEEFELTLAQPQGVSQPYP